MRNARFITNCSVGKHTPTSWVAGHSRDDKEDLKHLTQTARNIKDDSPEKPIVDSWLTAIYKIAGKKKLKIVGSKPPTIPRL